MKRFLIAGNWKMNKTTAQAVHYVHELNAQKLTNPESVAIIARIHRRDFRGHAEGNRCGLLRRWTF